MLLARVWGALRRRCACLEERRSAEISFLLECWAFFSGNVLFAVVSCFSLGFGCGVRQNVLLAPAVHVSKLVLARVWGPLTSAWAFP